MKLYTSTKKMKQNVEKILILRFGAIFILYMYNNQVVKAGVTLATKLIHLTFTFHTVFE